MLDLVFDFLSVFVLFPVLAFVPAVIYFLLYRNRKLRTILITAILWALYAAYELSIKYGITCPQGCNIRVDLLIVYPLLLIISLVAIVMYFRHRI